jgi:hypothetical protein
MLVILVCAGIIGYLARQAYAAPQGTEPNTGARASQAAGVVSLGRDEPIMLRRVRPLGSATLIGQSVHVAMTEGRQTR